MGWPPSTIPPIHVYTTVVYTVGAWWHSQLDYGMPSRCLALLAILYLLVSYTTAFPIWRPAMVYMLMLMSNWVWVQGCLLSHNRLIYVTIARHLTCYTHPLHSIILKFLRLGCWRITRPLLAYSDVIATYHGNSMMTACKESRPCIQQLSAVLTCGLGGC